MGEVTKTLELQLVDPNSHKQRKLRQTQVPYQQAHQAAFDAGCETQSAANDVVVNYDLSGYAKNDLKKYVPQLCSDSYDAKEFHDDHHVRFTNEGQNSTTSHRTASSGTTKSHTTRSMNSGFRHVPIPNNENGLRRCMEERPKWVSVDYSTVMANGTSTSSLREPLRIEKLVRRKRRLG